MNLQLNLVLANQYSSSSQIVRIITEDWVKSNSYCPNCGKENIDKYSNNKPVADFVCQTCKEDYELKSKNGILGNTIVDGAYSTMMQRIGSENNPNFFFLTYNKSNWQVNNFIIIPKHFFIPEVVIKRKPLSVNARRSGWTGCNIDLKKIPSIGRIFLVQDSSILSKKEVLELWKKTFFLRTKSLAARGWTLDILNYVDRIQKKTFTLSDIYSFENELKAKYPKNNFIKDKIRQQLQILRDKGVIEFVGKGSYKLI
jgi:type II restriction enzyme